MWKIKKKIRNSIISFAIFSICIIAKSDLIHIPINFNNLSLNGIFSEQSSNHNKLSQATVVRVVDGDTIVVNRNGVNEKIRFLTVNTEESVSRIKSKNNKYGKMASEYSKNFFKAVKTVYLQFDESKKDQFGRTLAYVWTSKDVDTDNRADIEKYMYNAILLKKGYAVTVVYEPNHYYADTFKSIEKKARENQVGLWKYKGFRNLHKN